MNMGPRIVILLALSFLLLGCAPAPPSTHVRNIELLDGRTVMCIHIHHGMSCDWENAR